MPMKVPEIALNYQKYFNAAEMLKAIAHPYRLEILRFLENNGFKAVFEIQESTGIEPTLLSHHLNRLKDKGILTSLKEGRYIYYKLALQKITKVLDCIDNCDI